MATGNITSTAGNFVVGTSGQGIDFSATPGTGTSELLADYEEGTWTPTGDAGLTSPSGASGKYTKVGRMVYCFGAITSTAITGDITIGGLPFTSSADRQATVTAYLTGAGATSFQNFFVEASSTTFYIKVVGSSVATSTSYFACWFQAV